MTDILPSVAIVSFGFTLALIVESLLFALMVGAWT